MSKYHALPFSKHDKKEDPAITSYIPVLYQYFTSHYKWVLQKHTRKKKAWNCKTHFIFISHGPRKVGILASKPPLINSGNLP